MKAAMLIDGVDTTYVFVSALESLERWFLDDRYTRNNMNRPLWVELSDDGKSALIIYNGAINNGKECALEYESEFFTEKYNDSRINNAFSIIMDPLNKIGMKATDGVYFINENSSADDIKAFAERVKKFSAKTVMNPASIAAMESHTDESTMFKILEKAAAESEQVALEIALEKARKDAELMEAGLEDFEGTDVKALEEEIDILNSKPSEYIDPKTFNEPEDLVSEVKLEDFTEEELGKEVPIISEDDTTDVDLTHSEAVLRDSNDLDDKEVDKKDKTPNNGLVEALEGLKDKLGITDAELMSRLEKVLLIGKLAGGVQSAAVEEEKAPIAENSIPEENSVDEIPEAVKPGRGADANLHYIDTPDGVVSNISAEELFGDDYGAGNEVIDNSEDEIDTSNVEEVKDDNTEEIQEEEPKEIDESLTGDDLLKELANESKNDDEFFDMLIARKNKFGLPTLIKAANIDMRTKILTGVENNVEASVKSKRVNLI